MPTPEDHIIQRAHSWRITEKEVIAAQGDAKIKAQSAHQDAKKKLREAVDLVERRKVKP